MAIGGSSLFSTRRDFLIGAAALPALSAAAWKKNLSVDRAKAATIAPPGENPKRKYPALARNRRGETLLAWVEGSGWGRGGRLGWRIFDRKGRPAAASDTQRSVPAWSFPAVFVRQNEGFTIVV